MITIKKLHNDVPQPIKFKDEDTRPVMGGHIIPACNASVFLVAKRNSGKTTTLFKLLKSCINKKETHVFIFCANLYIDKAYKVIREWLKVNKISWTGFTAVVNEKTNNLKELSDMIKELAEEEDSQGDDEEVEDENGTVQSKILLPSVKVDYWNDDSDDEKQSRKKNNKYQTPKYIIIFDDMSDQLKGPHLETLLKNGRHFARVIISSQYLHDIAYGSRKQIGYWLVFKSNRDKLPIIHKDADLSIDYNVLEKLYDKAVSEPYNFLYVDTREEEFRIGFNRKFVLPKEDI